MTANPRWKRRPEGSTWGDFGPDDQLGRLNLVTPEKVLQGIAEVKLGKTFCLSLPLDYPGGNVINPRRRPPVLKPNLREGSADHGPAAALLRSDRARHRLRRRGAADPAIFDAVGQPGACRPDVRRRRRRHPRRRASTTAFVPARDIVGPMHLRREGQGDATRCDQARAPVTRRREHGGRLRAGPRRDDRPAGAFRPLRQDGRLRGPDDGIDKDKVVVEPGDFVCIRTGFAELLLEMKKQPDPQVLFSTTSRWMAATTDCSNGSLTAARSR